MWRSNGKPDRTPKQTHSNSPRAALLSGNDGCERARTPGRGNRLTGRKNAIPKARITSVGMRAGSLSGKVWTRKRRMHAEVNAANHGVPVIDVIFLSRVE